MFSTMSRHNSRSSSMRPRATPIVVVEEERVISVANFEILPLAAALDYLRLVLATALTSSAERMVKLLGAPWTGLPTGLTPLAGTTEAGLTYLSLAAQSLAVEARLLAGPVSFELISTSHAEGIEDRTTMAPLAARRVAEMVESVSESWPSSWPSVPRRWTCGAGDAGRGTEAAVAIVREVVPFLDDGRLVTDVEPLVVRVREGAFVGGLAAAERAAGSDRVSRSKTARDRRPRRPARTPRSPAGCGSC